MWGGGTRKEEPRRKGLGGGKRALELEGQLGAGAGGAQDHPCQPGQGKAPTLAILLLLSAVRNDMLLISFCTTKFCSSRLKFW